MKKFIHDSKIDRNNKNELSIKFLNQKKGEQFIEREMRKRTRSRSLSKSLSKISKNKSTKKFTTGKKVLVKNKSKTPKKPKNILYNIRMNKEDYEQYIKIYTKTKSKLNKFKP